MTDTRELSNKTIVVTGARGTLGRAVCRTAAQAGAAVIGVDIAEGNGAEGLAAYVTLDLGNARAATDGLAAIAKRHGRIDALVNIAGGFAWETLAEGSVDTWDAMYQINLRTAVNACRGVLDHLPARGGRIVNVGAAPARHDVPQGLAAYAAAKSGVHRLTEALADELKARDTTVNAVLPSIIDTAPNREAMPDADFSTWVAPAALADVICFLLSERAAAVTGALIPVTGRV